MDYTSWVILANNYFFITICCSPIHPSLSTRRIIVSACWNRLSYRNLLFIWMTRSHNLFIYLFIFFIHLFAPINKLQVLCHCIIYYGNKDFKSNWLIGDYDTFTIRYYILIRLCFLKILKLFNKIQIPSTIWESTYTTINCVVSKFLTYLNNNE